MYSFVIPNQNQPLVQQQVEEQKGQDAGVQAPAISNRKPDVIDGVGDIEGTDDDANDLMFNFAFQEKIKVNILKQCASFQQTTAESIYNLCQIVRLHAQTNNGDVILPDIKDYFKSFHKNNKIGVKLNQLLYRNNWFFPTTKLMYGPRSTMNRYYQHFRKAWFVCYHSRYGVSDLGEAINCIYNNAEDRPKKKSKQKKKQKKIESSSSVDSSYQKDHAKMTNQLQSPGNLSQASNQSLQALQAVIKKRKSPQGTVGKLVKAFLTERPAPQELVDEMLNDGVFLKPSYRDIMMRASAKQELNVIKQLPNIQRLGHIVNLGEPRDIFMLCKALEDDKILFPYPNVAGKLQQMFQKRNLLEELLVFFPSAEEAKKFIKPLIVLCLHLESGFVEIIIKYIATVGAQLEAIDEFVKIQPNAAQWEIFLFGKEQQADNQKEISILIADNKQLQNFYIIHQVMGMFLKKIHLQFLSCFKDLNQIGFDYFKAVNLSNVMKLKQFMTVFIDNDLQGTNAEMENFMTICLKKDEKEYLQLLTDPHGEQQIGINEKLILERIEKDIIKFKTEIPKPEIFKSMKVDFSHAKKIMKINGAREMIYQTKIVQFCVEYIMQRNHLMVELATGHGKSVILQLLADVLVQNYQMQVYIICPNKYLTFQSQTLRAQRDEYVGKQIKYGILEDLVQSIMMEHENQVVVLLDEYDQILDENCSMNFQNKYQIYLPNILRRVKFIGISGSITDKVQKMTNIQPGQQVQVLILSDQRDKTLRLGKFQSHEIPANIDQITYINQSIVKSLGSDQTSAIVICDDPKGMCDQLVMQFQGLQRFIVVLEEEDLTNPMKFRQTYKMLQMLKEQSFILFTTKIGGRGVDTVARKFESVILHIQVSQISSSEFVQFIGRTTRDLEAIENIHIYSDPQCKTKTSYYNMLYNEDIGKYECIKGVLCVACLFSQIKYCDIPEDLVNILKKFKQKIIKGESLNNEEFEIIQKNLYGDLSEVLQGYNIKVENIKFNEFVYRQEDKYHLKDFEEVKEHEKFKPKAQLFEIGEKINKKPFSDEKYLNYQQFRSMDWMRDPKDKPEEENVRESQEEEAEEDVSDESSVEKKQKKTGSQMTLRNKSPKGKNQKVIVAKPTKETKKKRKGRGNK